MTTPSVILLVFAVGCLLAAICRSVRLRRQNIRRAKVLFKEELCRRDDVTDAKRENFLNAIDRNLIDE